MDSEILRTKNKRLRKTILEEHMPPEMQVRTSRFAAVPLDVGGVFQEAFFGMELANQHRLTNPLDDTSQCNDYANMNFKCLDNEYSIELDADTIKCLAAKKKGPLSLFNDDEHEMRTFDGENGIQWACFSFLLVEPIFGNDEFTDLVTHMLNPVPNPPCKRSDFNSTDRRIRLFV